MPTFQSVKLNNIKHLKNMQPYNLQKHLQNNTTSHISGLL